MTHETAQQRARRHKSNPLRAAQLAPLVYKAAMCAREGCGDPPLIHRNRENCLRNGCTCTEFLEAP